jgi:uroporphyrin-III C-methyltransferase
MSASRGRVSIVGAGPGDPGLLTVRGRELLRSADAVVHDRLVSPEIVALARRATRYDVGKLPGRAGAQQAVIEALLVDLALTGQHVVRLKGGDPFVFGRSGSELDALVDAGIPFEIVPGVSSAIAAPAYAGVPVTDRRYAGAVVIVTATQAADDPVPVDWSAIAKVPTVVVLMGAARADGVAGALLANGVPPERPAVAVQWGTTQRQRVVRSTLGALARDMADAGLGSPATIVVGEVASLAARYRWSPFERLTPSPSATARRGPPSAPLPLRRAPRRIRTRGTTRERRAAARPGGR